MNSILTKEPGIGRMIAFSLLFHASLVGVIYRLGDYLNPPQSGEQTYYVDVVNLPVANPRSGNPSPSAESSAPEPPSTREEMKLPPVSPKKPVTSEKTHKEQKPVKPAETREEFAERLARLERKVEGKRLGEKFDALRRKTGAGGRSGIPGARGTESGSDYASYIQSRLRDAFNETIDFQSRNPEMVVKLRINRFGKVIGYRVERSSHDKTFESSVARAIDMAGEKFPPPPGGEDFEHGYIFRPQGVGRK